MHHESFHVITAVQFPTKDNNIQYSISVCYIYQHLVACEQSLEKFFFGNLAFLLLPSFKTYTGFRTDFLRFITDIKQWNLSWK